MQFADGSFKALNCYKPYSMYEGKGLKGYGVSQDLVCHTKSNSKYKIRDDIKGRVCSNLTSPGEIG